MGLRPRERSHHQRRRRGWLSHPQSRGARLSAQRRLIAAALALLGALAVWPAFADEPDAVAAAIQALAERDSQGETLVVEGAPIASQVLMPRFYEQRRFAA